MKDQPHLTSSDVYFWSNRVNPCQTDVGSFRSAAATPREPWWSDNDDDQQDDNNAAVGQTARLEPGSGPNRPLHSPSPQRLRLALPLWPASRGRGGNCSTAGEEKVWNRLPIVCLWSMAPCWDSSRHTPAIANFTTGSCRVLAQNGPLWVITWPILGWTSLVLTSP